MLVAPESDKGITTKIDNCKLRAQAELRAPRLSMKEFMASGDQLRGGSASDLEIVVEVPHASHEAVHAADEAAEKGEDNWLAKQYMSNLTTPIAVHTMTPLGTPHDSTQQEPKPTRKRRIRRTEEALYHVGCSRQGTGVAHTGMIAGQQATMNDSARIRRSPRLGHSKSSPVTKHADTSL